MNHVVVNLEKVDAYVGSLSVGDRLSKWLSKVLKKEFVTRRDWLISSPATKSDDEYVQKAIDVGEDLFKIVFSNQIKSEIHHVMDWLAELERRDPRLFSKLDRITWKQAVEHSTRWHEQLSRSAEKVKDESIPFDENCPVMYTHDDGMKWVWLKTDKARDDEGRVMGHCVGSGGYDRLNRSSGVFSLRDSSGRPHVTVELDLDQVVQAQMKGNVDVSDKYLKHVDDFRRFMAPKLMLTPNFNGSDHLVWWTGDDEFYKNGRLHSDDDIPSRIDMNGVKYWYFNGKRHREDGPAVVKPNGDREWYHHGLRHRDGKPAIEYFSGSMAWFHNGRLHREDGPAVFYSKGSKEWYLDGRRHRLDGPAIIFPNGDEEWWFNGKKHREDGPAVVTSFQKVWYSNGKLHRLDGPAIISSDGDEEWWFHGERHRVGGPAVVHKNGSFEYWNSGNLHREDGPATLGSDGIKEWYENGLRHRVGGPAVVRSDGSEEWYFNGKLHRDDGPAIIKSDGSEYWWVNGVQIVNPIIGSSFSERSS